MKVIFVLLMTFYGTASASGFEGVWNAKGQCDFGCSSKVAEIEYRPATNASSERVIVKLKGGNWGSERTYFLEDRDSRGQDIVTRADLSLVNDGFVYSYYKAVYGLRESTHEKLEVELVKQADSTFYLSIREHVSGSGVEGRWRHYDYALTR